MAYADFAFYQESFFGTAITDSQVFRQAAERASEYLDMVTFDRLCTGIPAEYETKIRKCCCALAEAVYLYQFKANSSGDAARPKTQETIGAYSVSYGSVSGTLSALLNGETAGLEDYLQSICMKYLGTSGLLFRGCG